MHIYYFYIYKSVTCGGHDKTAHLDIVLMHQNNTFFFLNDHRAKNTSTTTFGPQAAR